MGGNPTLVGALLPTPTAKLGDPRRGAPSPEVAADRLSSGRRNLDDAAALVQPGRWGVYDAAVARWAAVLDRPAPDPTEPRPATMRSIRACADDWGVDGWAARQAIRGGWWGGRLSPPFVEWMMGAPAGWVTAVPGVSRSAQLARLGNGVVPQQAAAALRLLLGGAP